jgi:hypothetical protein
MVRFEPIVALLAALPSFSFASVVPHISERNVASYGPGELGVRSSPLTKRADPYWMETIAHNGTFPKAWGGADDYKVFRNVKDFGAKGDGETVSFRPARTPGSVIDLYRMIPRPFVAPCLKATVSLAISQP